MIIDTRSTVKTLLFSLFSLSTPYRIGSKKGYNFFLHNYRIDNHRDKSVDMVQHNLKLLKPLEKESEIYYCPDFKLYVSEHEKVDCRFYMQKQGIDFTKPVVIATVTARLAHKVWDKERMKEVLRRMIDKYDTQIIFNFAGNEEEFAVNIHREMGNDKNVFTNIKAGSLRDLCALIDRVSTFERSINELGESISDNQLLGNKQLNLVQKHLDDLDQKQSLVESYTNQSNEVVEEYLKSNLKNVRSLVDNFEIAIREAFEITNHESPFQKLTYLEVITDEMKRINETLSLYAQKEEDLKNLLSGIGDDIKSLKSDNMYPYDSYEGDTDD